MLVVKELGAQRLVERVEYLANNSLNIVNGLRCAGIPNALEGYEYTEDKSGKDSDTLSENDY